MLSSLPDGEPVLSLQERWHRIKWNYYAKVQRPGKEASSWRKRLASLVKGKWAGAESQRCMPSSSVMKNGQLPWEEGLIFLSKDEWTSTLKVKLVCQIAAPWKTDIFLREKVELFFGGWVSLSWVIKRDDAENEKNDYETNKRKRKCKHLGWCHLIYKKIFSFSGKDLQR